MADGLRIEITNWKEHQHYGKRNPPWIKLHSDLLDNAEWGVLSGDAAKLLVTLWLMAAKAGTDGIIDTTWSKLEWRSRYASTALAHLLNVLRANDFLTYASAALAPLSREVREAENREQPEEQSSVATQPAQAPSIEASAEPKPGEEGWKEPEVKPWLRLVENIEGKRAAGG